MIFAMIPGDARQEYLAQLLRQDGHRSPAYRPGLEADCYVFPLPTGRHPLLEALPPGSLVLAGQPRGDYPALRLRDYYALEDVQIENAVLTAEGAIAAAMADSDRSLWGSRALILGYGRIGRALAPRLRALGAALTVYARRPESRSWAEAEGCGALGALTEPLRGFDFVFNTVPEPLLERVPEGLCIELASAPGALPEDPAVRIARGLPGKCAPRTAAEILRKAIYRILKEESTL